MENGNVNGEMCMKYTYTFERTHYYPLNRHPGIEAWIDAYLEHNRDQTKPRPPHSEYFLGLMRTGMMRIAIPEMAQSLEQDFLNAKKNGVPDHEMDCIHELLQHCRAASDFECRTLVLRGAPITDELLADLCAFRG